MNAQTLAKLGEIRERLEGDCPDCFREGSKTPTLDIIRSMAAKHGVKMPDLPGMHSAEGMRYSDIEGVVMALKKKMKEKVAQAKREKGFATPKRRAAHTKYLKAAQALYNALDQMEDALADIEDAV